MFITKHNFLFRLSLLMMLNLALGISDSHAVDDEDKESPWLLAPTLSSDPKLGTSVGVLGGYLYQFDTESTQSMFLAGTSYSTTDSWMAGVFGQMFFDKNRQKLIVGYVGGQIRNDYQDFLGSGIPAQTTDELKAGFVRYSHSVSGNWYVGTQLISSNYAIGAEGFLELAFDLIGLTGFDSTGIGLVAEHDTRDNVRNPKKGHRFEFHNIAYRESLGGDVSFDVYNMKYSQYKNHDQDHVFAWQLKGRWTDDAPIGGYSSVELRGYVRGNYLAPHHTHINIEERIAFGSRWGMSFFAGVACLYDQFSDCEDSSDVYTSAGAGLIYTLKEKAGIVLRAEFAKGESDEYVGYLKVGNPF